MTRFTFAHFGSGRAGFELRRSANELNAQNGCCALPISFRLLQLEEGLTPSAAGWLAVWRWNSSRARP